MRSHTNDRRKGTLDLLVLKVLASQGKNARICHHPLDRGDLR
jgi:hypothetical protein